MERHRDERSLGELFGELSRETSTLVRQEVALAKAELSHKAAKLGRYAGYVGVGGAIAYAGFLAIVFAVALLIARIMPGWLAALAVGIVVAGVGYAIAQKGLSELRRADLVPRETAETLKEDAAWIKDQVS